VDRTAGILVIGNEILSGKVVDTNSPFLTRELRSLGVTVRRILTIPDELDEIAAAVAEFHRAYDFVFTSGGVGPTHDDLTIAGVARGLGRQVIRHPAIEGRLREFYQEKANAARLRLLTQAAARLGVDIIEAHVGGVAAVAGRWKGRCDRVLVDAPCSNLGVLRRNPDVKWNRDESDLGRLAEKQRGILAAAAALARPGGRLVYATCSLEPEENDQIVRAFLDGHPDWKVDPPLDFPVAPDPDGFIRCLPHVHGTDGFTAVRLARATRP